MLDFDCSSLHMQCFVLIENSSPYWQTHTIRILYVLLINEDNDAPCILLKKSHKIGLHC